MKITVNQVCLDYEISGEGAPLLLLHGNGEDKHIFDAIAPKLAKHFTVYAIDSRNHGLSRNTDDFSYQAMTLDIIEFITALGLGRVCLAGFSDGAVTGLMLAIQRPELVEKLALLGVNLSPGDFTPDSLEFVKATYEQTHDPLFKLMLEQPDIALEQAAQVAHPTLIVAGEQDVFKPETFTNLAGAMPNARLVIMKGHDHGSYIIGSDVLYSELIGFLRR